MSKGAKVRHLSERLPGWRDRWTRAVGYDPYGMAIEIIHAVIARDRLRDIAAQQFGDFVKAVVDVERSLMAIGGDMHADEEAALLDNGSVQRNLWGINLYPDLPKEQWVEFDSMINVRPSEGNRSRDVQNPEIRAKIIAIVERLVQG